MKTELPDIQEALEHLLSAHVPPLRIRVDSDTNFEVAGTKATMQGRQQVEGHYFANIVPKPKDIRLYFFPIYTHAEEFGPLSGELQKCLKGKSCFHLKKLSAELETEIREMIANGVRLYERDQLI